MDQGTLVLGGLDGGRQLVEQLTAGGSDVRVAFWAKTTDDGHWYLYLAAPEVDRAGTTAAYRAIHATLRRLPDLWVDPFEIKVISPSDPMAVAAEQAIRPVPASGPFAVPNPKPHPGITRYTGLSLGGVGVDAAYIYPRPAAAA